MRWKHALLAVLMVAAGASAAFAGGLDAIQAEHYELDNGLDVILYPDHSLPVVAVNVWYHVGSKNEKPGRTGFAHLFEHMMFQGSQHRDEDYFTPLQAVGANVNGSTAYDRTNYWENVPSNALETALWLEADRMGFLLPAMTQEKLDNQISVVQNERRQRVDNQPYGKANEILLEMLYPGNHPYYHSIIGSMDDLGAASLEDVKEFFRLYYAPNNASISIAGDFEVEEAKALVEKYFAPIPPGEPVDRMEAWAPELEQEIRAVAEDKVQLPRLYMVWHAPAEYTPGHAEMDLLVNVLDAGKNSRLYQKLVYENPIVQDFGVYNDSRELGSLLWIEVTGKPGASLDEIEGLVDEVIAELREEGVRDDEVLRARAAWSHRFLRRLEQVGGFGGIADRLNEYNTYLGDPNLLQWDYDRYQQVTVDDVNAVVRDYVDFDNRAVLHVLPQGQLAAKETGVDRSSEPTLAAEPEFTPPQVQKATLDNGLEILLVEDHKLPLVQAGLVFRSGWAADPQGQEATALLTAEMLDEGTKKRDALEIAADADAIGANLTTGSNVDGSWVHVGTMREHLDEAFGLMADVTLNPTFPDEELERLREIHLSDIEEQKQSPYAAALTTFYRELYGEDHPYSQPYTGTGTEESVKARTRKELKAFHKTHFVPNNAALVVAGDIGMKQLRKLAEEAFEDWDSGDVPAQSIPAPQPLEQGRVVIVDKPGAPQSVIVVGHEGMARADEDYLPMSVVNRALGGYFGSRVNMNLREDKGYTYGARTHLWPTRGTGPFFALSQVQGTFTAESIAEVVKEMKAITSERPLAGEELATTRDNLAKTYPQWFETLSDQTLQMRQAYLYGLSTEAWSEYIEDVRSVTDRQAEQLAQTYIHPDRLLIVIVGDAATVAPKIRDMELGEVSVIEMNEI